MTTWWPCILEECGFEGTVRLGIYNEDPTGPFTWNLYTGARLCEYLAGRGMRITMVL